MTCFYCIAEVLDIKASDLPYLEPVVTEYGGTPVCLRHANRIAATLKRFSNDVVYQGAMGNIKVEPE